MTKPLPWHRPLCQGKYKTEHGQIRLVHLHYGFKDERIVDVEPFVNLSDFRVLDEHQGQGHGRRMLQTVIDGVTERGLDLTLEVWQHNTVALHLYESLGFEVTGHWIAPERIGLYMRRTALRGDTTNCLPGNRASEAHQEGSRAMSTSRKQYPYNGRPPSPVVRRHQPTSQLARLHLKALHLATVKQGGAR